MHTVSLLISGMASSLPYSLNILLDFEKTWNQPVKSHEKFYWNFE